MTLQALLGQHWPDQSTLWAGLDARRAMLNEHIPSTVFQGLAPLQVYPEAVHSGRISRPEWEAEMLDLDRVFAYLASCRWFRRVRANGRLDLGGYDYYLGTTWRNHMLELHFDAQLGSLLGQPVGSEITLTFAPQGLTKTELMGELSHLLALPVYQLALPFTHEAWRQLEYTYLLTQVRDRPQMLLTTHSRRSAETIRWQIPSDDHACMRVSAPSHKEENHPVASENYPFDLGSQGVL